MSADPRFPLNEPQERKLAILLARLESDLDQLRETLRRPPRDLALNRVTDPIDSAAANALEETIAAVETRLHAMARELDLPPMSQPVRRSFLARLELLTIDLYEARPTAGLRGYGAVAASTAAYLEREIPDLEAMLSRIIRLLERAPDAGSPPR